MVRSNLKVSPTGNSRCISVTVKKPASPKYKVRPMASSDSEDQSNPLVVGSCLLAAAPRKDVWCQRREKTRFQEQEGVNKKAPMYLLVVVVVVVVVFASVSNILSTSAAGGAIGPQDDVSTGGGVGCVLSVVDVFTVRHFPCARGASASFSSRRRVAIGRPCSVCWGSFGCAYVPEAVSVVVRGVEGGNQSFSHHDVFNDLYLLVSPAKKSKRAEEHDGGIG